MKRFSKKMVRLMAEEFFGLQLSDKQLSQVIERLETWLQDIEDVDPEMLEQMFYVRRLG